MSRLVVLASGHGSNLQAILHGCADGTIDAAVEAVVSDRPEAFALERARCASVAAVAFPHRAGEDRHAYDARLADEVTRHSPDWVVLAGWMRILSSAFLDRFPSRVVNLHPALPGEFPGTHAVERAFDAHRHGGAARTGVMVHLVPNEGVDDGPVLATAEVVIEPDDTVDTLTERVHHEEHRILVATLARLCSPTSQLAQENV